MADTYETSEKSRKSCESRLAPRGCVTFVPNGKCYSSRRNLIPYVNSQIIEMILLRLRPADRLKSAMTCKNWANLVSCSPCLKDVRRVIHGGLSGLNPSILNPNREYNIIRVEGGKQSRMSESDSQIVFDMTLTNLFPRLPGDLSRVFRSLSKIREHIRELELVGCTSRPDVFWSFLGQFPNLKTLSFSGKYQNFTPLFCAKCGPL